jgi:hypothetical protein
MRPAHVAILMALAFASGWCLQALYRTQVVPDGHGLPRASSLPVPREPVPAPPHEHEASPEVRPVAAETELAPHTVARSGCRLTGTACDEDGLALAGLELLLQPCPNARPRDVWSHGLALLPDASVRAQTTCDGSGAFAFDDVPAGGWALTVRGDADLPQASYGFRLTDDQRAVHKRLVLARGLRLSGLVLDPEGRPCPGAQLDVSGLDADYREIARSGSDGRFALGPLLAGRYRLEASAAESLTLESRIVRAGEDPLELRLAPAGLLCVRVRDESGAPVVARVELHGPSERSEVGADVRLTRLTPGSYGLVARTDDGRSVMLGELTLEAGLAPVPLELVLGSASIEPAAPR